METVTNSIYFIGLVVTELSNIIVSDFGAKKIGSFATELATGGTQCVIVE